MNGRKWNRMNSEEKYNFLCSVYGQPDASTERGYALQNVLAKFGLETWQQLPVLMRRRLETL